MIAVAEIPYESIGLTTALIIVVVTLWRFIIAGLNKRDSDRDAVVQVHQERAEAAEKDKAEMVLVISNNTKAMRAMTEQLKAQEGLCERLGQIVENHDDRTA